MSAACHLPMRAQAPVSDRSDATSMQARSSRSKCIQRQLSRRHTAVYASRDIAQAGSWWHAHLSRRVGRVQVRADWTGRAEAGWDGGAWTLTTGLTPGCHAWATPSSRPGPAAADPEPRTAGSRMAGGARARAHPGRSCRTSAVRQLVLLIPAPAADPG